MDRAFVADALQAVVDDIAESEVVFAFAPEHYRNVWWKALDALNLRWCGPPHSVRHFGPSADIAFHTRGLELVRRRGRWVAPTTVQRYTKDFRLTQHLAKLPEDVLACGVRFLKSPRKVWEEALCEAPTQDINSIVMKGLQRRQDILCPGAPPLPDIGFFDSVLLKKAINRDAPRTIDSDSMGI